MLREESDKGGDRPSAPRTIRRVVQWLPSPLRIELLVAIDVIESAISEGTKHVDLEALKRVLAKLTAAHNWKKRCAR
jgi:hypothetical protein